MIRVIYTLIKHELRLSYRYRTELINPLLFFILVITLFPLAVSPDNKLLYAIAPGLIWVAALLAILLSLDKLFKNDYEDGSLNLILLSPYPLSLLVLAKVIAYWLAACLPLIILSPVMALVLHLNVHETIILLDSLLLGTPTLCLLGAVGSGLTVGLRSNNVLLSLVLLPLYVPVLIFGAGTVVNAQAQIPVKGELALLGALLLLAITLAPLATAAALRIGAD